MNLTFVDTHCFPDTVWKEIPINLAINETVMDSIYFKLMEVFYIVKETRDAKHDDYAN